MCQILKPIKMGTVPKWFASPKWVISDCTERGDVLLYVTICLFKKKSVLSQVWRYSPRSQHLGDWTTGTLPYVWGQFGIPMEFQATVGYSRALSQEKNHTNKLTLLLLSYLLHFLSLSKRVSEKFPIQIFGVFFACISVGCVFACGGAHLCAVMWRQKIHSASFPWPLPTLFTKAETLTEPRAPRYG